MFRLLLFVAFYALATARSPLYRDVIASPKSSSADYLLPNNLTVSLYEIVLEPDFDTDTFNGSVRITFTTLIATDRIVLHTYEIDINAESIGLYHENGTVAGYLESADYSNDDRHFYTVIFSNDLSAGMTYTLEIVDFVGILNLDMYGFYLARYEREDGTIKKIATTQFQPTSARRAFPCFDEPALKAQFDISIIRTAEYHSLANTPRILSIEITRGRYLDVFQRTVVMSTYLVAFVVSDYTYVRKDIHRVYGKPQDIARNRADYALDIGIKIFDGIEEWVEIPYSLDKMDQIGIPDDYFSAGAMENWGLVTYRDEFLMYETNVTTSDTEEFIAIIIGHEFGHQWFGNLVGPTWWSYLWLNEGFATYFNYFGGAMANDDFELFDQMVVQSVQIALGRDSNINTRPMSQDAGSPADVLALFDIVAYDKAGAVIRMAEGFLTTPVFRRGLYIYLRKREYGAAEPSDLYSSWQEAVDETNLAVVPDGETIESVLTTWESNPGYPLIRVTVNSGVVEFSQRRFIDAWPDNNYENLWYVPITTATASNPEFNDTSTQFWLTTRSLTTTLPNLGANDWLIVNVQQIGYYRVNYDVDNWYRIIDALLANGFSNIHRANRAMLVDDAYTFARYGVIDYEIPLRLTTYFTRENDYIAMFPFFQALNFLEPHIANSIHYFRWQNYVQQILNTSYSYVGLTEFYDDNHIIKKNRERISNWMCRYYDFRCLEYATQRLMEWRQSEDHIIVPNQQTIITCAALRQATPEAWNFVLERYIKEEMVVRRRLLRALGCSQNNTILNGFVNAILFNSTAIRPEDRLQAFASIYNSGNFGLNFVWTYVRDNYAELNTGLTVAQVSSLFNGLATRFTMPEQFLELQEFAIRVGAAQTALVIALETVLSNAIWTTMYLPTITNWLIANGY